MLMPTLIVGVVMICTNFCFNLLRIGELNLAITDYSSALGIETEHQSI